MPAVPVVSEPEEIPYNFGCLPPMPDGWYVAWHPNLEMYMGHGPNEWESLVCWNPHWVRQWCIDAAAKEASEG